LTSEDAFTAADLATLLSKHLGREIRVSASNAGPVPMAAYFGLVAAGAYKTTDTAAKVLGRAPRAYADWLQQHLPQIAAAQ
jgi:hypothetical protein